MEAVNLYTLKFKDRSEGELTFRQNKTKNGVGRLITMRRKPPARTAAVAFSNEDIAGGRSNDEAETLTGFTS
eukprot:5910314-Amphidinium_carterae.1